MRQVSHENDTTHPLLVSGRDAIRLLWASRGLSLLVTQILIKRELGSTAVRYCVLATWIEKLSVISGRPRR